MGSEAEAHEKLTVSQSAEIPQRFLEDRSTQYLLFIPGESTFKTGVGLAVVKWVR